MLAKCKRVRNQGGKYKCTVGKLHVWEAWKVDPWDDSYDCWRCFVCRVLSTDLGSIRYLYEASG